MLTADKEHPNPYSTPAETQSSAQSAIPDALIQRLVVGDRTVKLAIYDVSDCRLYGRKHRHTLHGRSKRDAESTGCVPIVYQAVLWFCLVYIPVWPMGTYVVIPEYDCDGPDGDADQYRGIRVTTDIQQVLVHYAACVLVAAAFGLLLFRLTQ